jgi:sulfonate transport system substrate-binding protein
VRSLAAAKLTERDVRLVLLQHPDGRTALERGDVDAWAGLDPIMAASEIESGAVLFYRDKAANSWGILNVRDEFANAHPDLVRRVLNAYERARKWSLENPDELRRILMAATGLSEPVILRQLERTELTHSTIGEQQRETILQAGSPLRKRACSRRTRMSRQRWTPWSTAASRPTASEPGRPQERGRARA